MQTNHKVWIIDDDRSIRWVLERALTRERIQTICFADADAALSRLGEESPALVISDIRMAGTDGLDLLQECKRRIPDLPVILMTAYSDLECTVSAFRGGALEFLPKPFDVEELVRLVKRSLPRRKLAGPQVRGRKTGHGLIGDAPAMQQVFRSIGRLSNSDLSVLITGESGTGKELAARALHLHSERSKQPFVAINTAAIPRDLLAAELFGHEKGAFTGAAARRPGRFEQAHTGTLFLDEIGDMPMDLQTPLLRVLSEGTFYRVGGTEPVPTDVRLIAATHQDLAEQVRLGRFREDLYYRLNVAQVQMPPLRNRRSDLEQLAVHFLHRAAVEHGSSPRLLLPATLNYLHNLDWPGNVRQLQNLCRWLTVMVPTREIHLEDLPAELAPAPGEAECLQEWEQGLRAWAQRVFSAGGDALLQRARPRFEQALIKAALDYTGGHRRQAAALLGMGRNTLSRRLREIQRPPDAEESH